MNLSTLLSSLCSRVPGEDLTDKQILSIKSDLGVGSASGSEHGAWCRRCREPAGERWR